MNKTMEYLIQNKIENLDFIFWTHPDLDHSQGIDKIIEKYLEEEHLGILCISNGICINEIRKSARINDDRNNIIYKCFDSINKASQKLKSNFYNIEHGIDEFGAEFVLNGETQILRIKPFSPLSHISRQFNIRTFEHLISTENKYTERKNLISVGLIISFGERKICLTSDIINNALDDVKYQKKLKDMLTNLDFFKIPHHGGKSSDIFLKLLRNDIKFAGVTTYHKTNPSIEILQKYKDKSKKLYCTSNINNRDANNHGYGKFILKIPFENEPIKVSVEGDTFQI